MTEAPCRSCPHLVIAVGRRRCVAFVGVAGHRHGPGARVARPRPRTEAELDDGEVATATLYDQDHARQRASSTTAPSTTVEFPDELHRPDHQRRSSTPTSNVRRRQPGGQPVAERSCSSLAARSSLADRAGPVRAEPGAGRRHGSWASASRGPRRCNKDQPKVTFADVAGLDEAVEELQEIKEFLESPAKFQEIGRQDPEGRAAVRAARHRQDAAGQGGGGRGGRAVLLDQRLRLRRDVRRRRRVAGARPVRAGEGRRRPRSSSSTRSTPSAATAAPGSAAGTTSASRRSTSCSSRWTASTRQHRRDPHRGDEPARHPRPRAAASRAASTARSSSTAPTSRAARRSSRCTRAASRSRDGVDLDVIARRTPGFTGADLANLMNEAALLSARREPAR